MHQIYKEHINTYIFILYACNNKQEPRMMDTPRQLLKRSRRCADLKLPKGKERGTFLLSSLYSLMATCFFFFFSFLLSLLPLQPFSHPARHSIKRWDKSYFLLCISRKGPWEYFWICIESPGEVIALANALLGCRHRIYIQKHQFNVCKKDSHTRCIYIASNR